jgi:hypothetical protein
MNTIKDQWESYKKDVLPKDAPQIQIRETRIAFYAGVHVTLLFMRDTLTQMSDEAGVVVLEAWHQECLAFAKNYSKGWQYG